jgi:hypothetical protein
MDDDDAFFVLDEHPFFQSVGKHVALLGHIILIPSQSVFTLTP